MYYDNNHGVNTMREDTPAIAAHKKSIEYAMSGNKAAWLALFADDAELHDPAGPSPHDPEGIGFRGRERLEEFWDTMIGPTDITVAPHKRYPCGPNIVAVAQTATNNLDGLKTYIEMIAVYEVNDEGKFTRFNVYWDIDALADQLSA